MKIVVRPGETPCEKSVRLAMTAQSGVRAILELMEGMDQSRTSALGMVLQCLCIEAGTIDAPTMERVARTVSANVAAALRGDQSGDTLDDMVAALDELERIDAKHKRELV